MPISAAQAPEGNVLSTHENSLEYNWSVCHTEYFHLYETNTSYFMQRILNHKIRKLVSGKWCKNKDTH